MRNQTLDYQTPPRDQDAVELNHGNIALGLSILPWLGTGCLFMLPSLVNSMGGRNPVFFLVPLSALAAVLIGIVACFRPKRQWIFGLASIVIAGGYLALFIANFNIC